MIPIVFNYSYKNYAFSPKLTQKSKMLGIATCGGVCFVWVLILAMIVAGIFGGSEAGMVIGVIVGIAFVVVLKLVIKKNLEQKIDFQAMAELKAMQQTDPENYKVFAEMFKEEMARYEAASQYGVQGQYQNNTQYQNVTPHRSADGQQNTVGNNTTNQYNGPVRFRPADQSRMQQTNFVSPAVNNVSAEISRAEIRQSEAQNTDVQPNSADMYGVAEKKFCSQCGAELRPGIKFCYNCGQKL